MQTAFEEYTKKDNTKVKYYDLIIPKGTTTVYWLASRCVDADSNHCDFYVRRVLFGYVGYSDMYSSIIGADAYSNSHALFPIVTLNSRLIKPGTTEGSFVVSLE